MHPIVETLEYAVNSMDLYKKFHHYPYTIFLDSSMIHNRLGRYSFISGDPFLVFSSKANKCYLKSAGKTNTYTANPFDLLQKLTKKYQLKDNEGLPPFPGGIAGYFSYDLGWHLEKLPIIAKDDISLPDCCLGFYDWTIAIDHLSNQTHIISTGFPKEEEIKRKTKAWERLKEIKEIINKKSSSKFILPEGDFTTSGKFASNFTKYNYLKSVEKIKEYIAAGDIYQANLTQRLHAEIKVSPLALYERLRKLNPAPFASFLNFPEGAVVSSSPERYIKVENGRVETRPIKGTRPRGNTPKEDKQLKEDLINSPKDRAELLMIVDLVRNDLSRVCEKGSIKVPELFTLEAYATVYHLVSTVEGILPPDKDTIDVLRASFPGGSITGCPKIRAMEIIEELEPTKRHIYTGSIGYIGFDGNSDLNIVIRTFLLKNNNAFFQVGGAIVADSDPESEYQETLDKAKALINALGIK